MLDSEGMKRMPPLSAAFLSAVLLAAASAVAQGPAAAEPPAGPSPFDVRCAELVLGGAGGARWIVADGPFAAALTQAARAAKSPAVVLPLLGGDEETLDRAEKAARAIPSADVRRALAHGVAPFVRAWLAEDPAAVGTNVYFVAGPALVEAAGFVALPDGLGYRAVAPDAVPERLAAAAESFDAARDELGELLAFDECGPSAPIRPLAAQAGNRLGCLLVRAGETNAALDKFIAASAVHTAAPSPVLNAASLVRRGARPSAAASVARRLDAIARLGENWSLYATGGPVLFPEDFLETGWRWALSGFLPFDTDSAARLKAAFESLPEGDRPAVAARLRQGMAPLATLVGPTPPIPGARPAAGDLVAAADWLFYRGERLRADRLLRKASFPTAAERATIVLARARLLATGGSFARAAAVLDEALKKASADPMPELDVSDRELFLRGLAEASVEALDLGGALPRLRALAAEKGIFAGWAGKTAAAIEALMRGDAAAANNGAATAVSLAAAAEPPFFPSNWAPLRIRAFFALQTGGMAAAAEAGAALLEARGGHDFFGHYVLALAAQAEGNAETADTHFQASLAERAVWFVLNDFAAALDARGATGPAVMFAQQAIALGGAEQAAVQDTLGTALLHAGRNADALAALRRAVALPGGDMPAIRLDLAEALAANGLFDELAAVLKGLDGAFPDADDTVRTRLRALRAALAAQGG